MAKTLSRVRKVDKKGRGNVFRGTVLQPTLLACFMISEAGWNPGVFSQAQVSCSPLDRGLRFEPCTTAETPFRGADASQIFVVAERSPVGVVLWFGKGWLLRCHSRRERGSK
ncbi:hypothetical protein TNCV_1496751 [Trichonephila clavipes]|nr:hypothetical protein TNCV_1496751 [Trichonephila clavipes]